MLPQPAPVSFVAHNHAYTGAYMKGGRGRRERERGRDRRRVREEGSNEEEARLEA